MTVEHILETEKETRKFRLLAVVLVAFAIYYAPKEVPWLPATLLALAYTLYALLLPGYIMPRSRTVYIVYAMIVVDTVALTLGLHLFGGVQSPFFIFFPVAIIYYAIYLGYASSLAAAIALSLAYAGYVIISRQEEFGATVGLQVPFFFLLATFSGYLARKRLQEREEKEALQELIRVEAGARNLLEVAQRFTASLDLERVLAQVVGSAPVIGRMSRCLILLPGEENARLVTRASNFDPQQLGLKKHQEITDVGLDDARRPLSLEVSGVTSQEGQDSPSRWQAWASRHGVATLLVVPLRHQEQHLGAVVFCAVEPTPSPSDAEMSLAQTFADLAAAAIANAQRHEQAEARISRLVGELGSTIERMERLRSSRQRQVLEIEGLTVDGPRERVTLHGQEIKLTPMEFAVLYQLADNAGTPLNQETLLRRAWGEDHTAQGNVVDVCMHRLRRKLEENPSAPRRILTIRGMGYMLSTRLGAPPRRR